MNLLIAEDDLKLGNLTKYMLQAEGHKVTWVTDGAAVLRQSAVSVYDVIVLDWMLPEMDGVTVCKTLRAADCHQPILMLTAKDAVSDRVTGLDAGADDYLVKPFQFSELFARLRALSRRTDAPLRDEVVQVKDIRLNRTSNTVYRGQEEIKLSIREFKLLDLLVKNHGQVVSRDVIFDRVWGINSDVSDNNIEAYIRLLRKKLEKSEGTIMIHTVRGIGYKVEY
jgi:DNA-binding response OmpR family regulator